MELENKSKNIIKNVKKIDTIESNSKITKTDEGYYIFEVPVAKVGVYKYLQPDGTSRGELIGADELFNKDSIESLKLKPVTSDHPEEKFIYPETVNKRQVGTVSDTITKQGDYLVVKMIVSDKKAIDEIENKEKQQFSPGLLSDDLYISGYYNGEKYDVIQTNRRYNHVALVKEARGGNELSIKLDSKDNDISINQNVIKIDKIDIINNNKSEGETMPTIRLDSKDCEASSEVITHIGRLDEKIDNLGKNEKQLKNDSAEKEKEFSLKLDSANSEISKITAERDTMKEKLDALEKRDIEKEINEGVKERLEVERVARIVLDSKEIEGIETKNNIDIKKEIVIKRYPSAKLDSKDSIYINSRFDAVVEDLEVEKTKNIDRQNSSTNIVFDNKKNDSNDSENKYRQASLNAWKREGK